MEKHITIIFKEDTLERVRNYSLRTKGKSKRLSETVNDIIEEYLNIAERETPPTHSDNTHTHKTGIQDILEFIEDNYSQGITKQKIDEAIKEFKGMDTRTIRKYEPEVIHNLLSLGYKTHPVNPNLYIKYEIPDMKERLP